MPKRTRSGREPCGFPWPVEDSVSLPILEAAPENGELRASAGHVQDSHKLTTAGKYDFPIFRKQASDRVLEPGPTTVVVSTADRFKVGPLEPGPALPYLQDARRARCGRCGRQARHFVARVDGIRWYCGKCRPGRAGELGQ